MWNSPRLRQQKHQSSNVVGGFFCSQRSSFHWKFPQGTVHPRIPKLLRMAVDIKYKESNCWILLTKRSRRKRRMSRAKRRTCELTGIASCASLLTIHTRTMIKSNQFHMPQKKDHRLTKSLSTTSSVKMTPKNISTTSKNKSPSSQKKPGKSPPKELYPKAIPVFCDSKAKTTALAKIIKQMPASNLGLAKSLAQPKPALISPSESPSLVLMFPRPFPNNALLFLELGV